MADFKNPIGDANPDFTRSSRGSIPDTSLATGISGLGKVADGAIKATDDFFQGRVRQESDSAVHSLFDEFGVQDAVTAETDISNPNQPTPIEVQRSGREIDKLSKAFKQGSLDQRHYYARLSSITRQLRARYPGYKQHVDQAVSRALGTPGHQALVTTMMKQAQAEAKSGDAKQKAYWSFVQSKGKYLGSIPGWEQLGQEDLRTAVARVESREHNLNQAHEKIKRTATANKLTKEENDTNYANATNDIANNLLTETYDLLTGEATSIGQFETNFRRAQQSGGRLDEKERVELGNQMTELKAKLLTQFDQLTTGGGDNKALNTSIDIDLQRKARERFAQQIDTYLQPMRDKDTGIVGSQQGHFNLMKDSATAAILGTKYGGIAMQMKILNEQFDPSIVQMFVGEDTEVRKKLKDAYNVLGQSILIGDLKSPLSFDLKQATDTSSTLSDPQKTKVLQGTAQAIMKVMNGIDTSNTSFGETNTDVIMKIFGEPEFLAKTYNGPARKELFGFLTSPKIRQKMMANDQYKTIYANWVTGVFPAVFHEPLSTINQNNSLDVKVSFDGKQFVTERQGAAARTSTARTRGNFQTTGDVSSNAKQVEEAVKVINSHLGALVEITDARPDQTVFQLLERYNVFPINNKGNIMDTFLGAIREWIDTGVAPGLTNKTKDEKKPPSNPRGSN